MKWTIYLITIFFFIHFQANAQTRIDSTFDFQNDPAKNFSIYIPSSYNELEPAKMMVALHPWNTARWDSESWCDTLIVFAETNDLFLICPDGGADGQISDSIDTAFTTLLIDEMQNWYNIDSSSIFLMGFSWGGQVTYSYGLNNVEKFKGFMPIGAAINGITEFSNVISNANNQRFYAVHGSLDSPNSTLYPALDSLQSYNACVNSNLVLMTGHTIDFANRNEILSEAFTWLDTVSCGPIVIDTMGMNTDTTMMDTLVNILEVENKVNFVELYPNPVMNSDLITIAINNKALIIKNVFIYDLSGQLIIEKINSKNSAQFSTEKFSAGEYIVKIITENNIELFKRLLVY